MKNQCENNYLFGCYVSNGPNIKGDSTGTRNFDFSSTKLGFCNRYKEVTTNAREGDRISGIKPLMPGGNKKATHT